MDPLHQLQITGTQPQQMVTLTLLFALPVHPLNLKLMHSIDGSKIAYFRGRKLQGKSIKLPEQCRGVVVERKTDEIPPAETVDHIEEGDDVPERVGSMQIAAEFDELVVWGHESLADATGDPYIRSMEEWLQVADQVSRTCHSLLQALMLADSLLHRGGRCKTEIM
jgi:hypothetical protein